MRVLILYTELAGYVLGNIKRFLESNDDAKVLLVHYPVNPEAPFNLTRFQRSEFIEYQKEREDEIKSKVNAFNADIILCSGWSNAFYLKLIRMHSKQVKRIICFDNQWKGSFKQNILTIFSRFYLLRMFSYAWVPGNPQKIYALKLGFREKNIFTGLYPADTNFFARIGEKKLAQSKPYPKVMLSVARYIPQKDLPTLWNAFIAANSKTGNQWNLHCIGLGELYDSKIKNPYIKHLGFKQPEEIETFIYGSGVFVLPSIEEPWGVAVHEMALSALPLVLSNKVGAASMFLDKNNGFLFEAGNQKELQSVFENIMILEDGELEKLSKASFINGKKLLSEDWSKTLLKIYND